MDGRPRGGPPAHTNIYIHESIPASACERSFGPWLLALALCRQMCFTECGISRDVVICIWSQAVVHAMYFLFYNIGICTGKRNTFLDFILEKWVPLSPSLSSLSIYLSLFFFSPTSPFVPSLLSLDQNSTSKHKSEHWETLSQCVYFSPLLAVLVKWSLNRKYI